MKKLILASIIALLAFSASALEATVVSTKGKAEVQKGASWQPLEAGTKLEKGALIQTGFKSEIELKITSDKEDTTVTVAPLTRMTIEQLAESSDTDKTSLFLDTGSVRSEIKKKYEAKPVTFTVRSPVATASVRGTTFSFENKMRSTNVTTHEGKVAVYKTAVKTAQVASASDDAAIVAPNVTGNAPADIAADAPKGSFTVTKGQSAGFSSTGTVSTPQSKATTAAVSMPNSVPPTVAATVVAQESAAPVVVQDNTPVINPTVSTGSLNISVRFGN